MSFVNTLFKILGFPIFPEKGKQKFYHDNSTFNQTVSITGDTIQQSNSFTLKEKILCGNLWMLKNPFEKKPIIPNIFGSLGIIIGWSGVYVTGMLQTIGSKITIGSDIKLGSLDVSYTALKSAFNPFKSNIVKKKSTITPYDKLVAVSGKLIGIWTYNGRLVSTEPDSTSDIRLKKNITRFKDGLNLILNLKPVRFDWREDKCPSSFLQEFREPDDEYGYPGKVKRQYGLIAQEVEEIAPDLIGERKMYDETYKLIRYEKIVPILISAVQDQQKQIEELINEINALKEKDK